MTKHDTPVTQIMEGRTEGTQKSRAGGSVPEVPKAQPPKLHVGKEIADTTWRMTVPVVIFAFTGIYADIKLDSKPWLTFVGVIIGFYFAAVLVKQQLKRSEETS